MTTEVEILGTRYNFTSTHLSNGNIQFTCGCKHASWPLVDINNALKTAFRPLVLFSTDKHFQLTLTGTQAHFLEIGNPDPSSSTIVLTLTTFMDHLKPEPHSLPDYTFPGLRPEATYWADRPDRPRGFLFSHGDISSLDIDDFLALKEYAAKKRQKSVCSVHHVPTGGRSLEHVTGPDSRLTLITPK